RRLVQLRLDDGLDGDLAAESRIRALVHDSHGTAADRALDRVATERFQVGNGGGHGWTSTLEAGRPGPYAIPHTPPVSRGSAHHAIDEHFHAGGVVRHRRARTLH